MGGSNEQVISGLRLHINNGKVHSHDDVNNSKFILDSGFQEVQK